MMGYDKEGHTVYTKLGNGTETHYTYDNQRQRLQEMSLAFEGSDIMHNKYSYDAVDNILGITNSVNPQELFNNSAKLGGESSHSYQYDALNRLISASGKAKDASYTLNMAYNVMSMPVSKKQDIENSKKANSYSMEYKYEDALHPSAPSQIGHEHYTYDANGNPVRVENDSTDATRELYWDEDNRLMVLSDNGKTSRYTYNHAGERIVKSHGTMEGVYINGAPQGITFHETDEFTLYSASIISVNKNRFTKHYFIGSKRVASRIGSGHFNNVYGMNGCNITAGQQDYAERLNQIESQKEDYYRELGIAPGIPTMKGSYGDPENTGVGYNTIIRNLGDHSVPAEWAEYVKKNEQKGTAPGAPIAWESPSQPEEVQPGYGFIPDNESTEETFYYHSDHLGSTSYVTDDSARITQYTAYLPYGELLVDEHSSSEDMPYKFNGKELDEETGLYYYGARYMQPITSVWYGIDPLTEKYPDVSAYAYCMGNPVRLVDVDGMDWYLHDGQYVWQNSTDKTYKDKNGNLWNNVGHTFTDKKTGAYYSLFGQIYPQKHTALKAAKNIDNAVIEYAEYEAKRLDNQPESKHYKYSPETIPLPNSWFGDAYDFINDYSPLTDPNKHRLAYGENRINTIYTVVNNADMSKGHVTLFMEYKELGGYGMGKIKGYHIQFKNEGGYDIIIVSLSKEAALKNRKFFDKLVKKYREP